MNKREKILAYITGGVISVMLIYMVINALFLSPIETINTSIIVAEKSVATLKRTSKTMKRNMDHLAKLASQTYGLDDDEIQKTAFPYLMSTLDKSGLTSEGKGVTQYKPKNAGDLREISWRIIKNGKMEHILNLLYMLESDPVLHRIENLVITPRDRDGPFRVEFDYIALSLASKKGPQFATTRPAETTIAIDMGSKKRTLYNVIPERDIFRRYIKHVDPPKPPTVVTTKPPIKTTVKPPPAGPGPKYRICGLPTFQGQPEIWVTNEIDKTGAVHKYKEGEKLMGWNIVMVDYRPMPDPDNPELLSMARVIIKIDADYWAIEGNQYINAKRMLKDSELPAALKLAIGMNE